MRGGSENQDFVHLCIEGLVISTSPSFFPQIAILFVAVVNASTPDHTFSVCGTQ